MKNVFIDSNVIIAAEIITEQHHKESKKFMEYILSNKINGITFFTSIFTFLELASAMIRRTKNKDKTYSLLYRISKSWKKIINPIPLSSSNKRISPKTFSRELIDTLIEVAIKFGTKTGDTFQCHAIVENEIGCIVTWNTKDFTKLKKYVKGFKILTPLEMLENLKKGEIT